MGGYFIHTKVDETDLESTARDTGGLNRSQNTLDQCGHTSEILTSPHYHFQNLQLFTSQAK